MYETSFIVCGQGRFPFYMLYGEPCFPARGIDADAMLEEDRYREVQLIVRHIGKTHIILKEGWQNYGWMVLPQQETRPGGREYVVDVDPR